VAAAMSGTIWVDVDGAHLARATARATRPVSAFLALAKISELDLSLDSVPVPAGDWIPARIQMTTAGHVLGSRFSRKYLYEYGDYATPGQ